MLGGLSHYMYRSASRQTIELEGDYNTDESLQMRSVANIGRDLYAVSYTKPMYSELYIYEYNWRSDSLTTQAVAKFNDNINDIYADGWRGWFILARANGTITRG